MKYEIIATLGPVSSSEQIWGEMLEAGVSAFRLNTSHLTIDQLKDWLSRLLPFLERSGKSIPLVLDLQGSKWRLGSFQSFELVPGQEVELRFDRESARTRVLPVPHQDFFRAAPLAQAELRLNDAKSILIIESVHSDSIKAKVVRGGVISPGKGITYAFSAYRSETLTEKDKQIFEFTREWKSIRYAVSYIKDSLEMNNYRALMEQAYLIAKIERREAIAEAEQIARFAQELWLCRGDLGAELGFREMCEAIYNFSPKVPLLPVPVLLGGQTLEHMTQHPSPTRSELSCIYESLKAGYRGIILSDEAAVGRYPLDSCKTAAIFR